jgi:hypothetical protein
MEILAIAFLLATGKFLLICKFLPLRKVLRYDKYIDLFFTIVLPIAFHGTFSGMVTAIFSGLFLSLYLLIARFVVGVEPTAPKARRGFRS